MGLTLLGLPSALLAYSAGRSLLAFVAAAIAAGLGLTLLVTSLIRQRAEPGMVHTRESHLAASQVVLTAACVGLLNISALALVVR